MCDMTHSYVRHYSSICVTWLIHMCDMTHPYAWHDSSIGVTWLIHMCDMTHSYVWRISFLCTHSYVRHVLPIDLYCASFLMSGKKKSKPEKKITRPDRNLRSQNKCLKYNLHRWKKGQGKRDLLFFGSACNGWTITRWTKNENSYKWAPAAWAICCQK